MAEPVEQNHHAHYKIIGSVIIVMQVIQVPLSWYGMNFYMPEQQFEYSYPVFACIMAVIVVCLLVAVMAFKVK